MILSPPEPINSSHDLLDFNSSRSDLDSWLRHRAVQNHTRGFSRCFVVCDQSVTPQNPIIGFYTLSAGSIERKMMPKSIQRNAPGQIPVLLLGMLAVDQRYQHRGIGTRLLRHAILRAAVVYDHIGFSAIMLHAIDESVKPFYHAYGFIASPVSALTLLMPMTMVHAATGSTTLS
ncbi:MAG: GNAT family N-acetyltransferase [Magnetococcales bacterium]|nr:GNAT family N-acetyltransferase [Magnetococcales bacterium]